MITKSNSMQAVIVGTGFMSWVHWEALARLGIGVRGVLGSGPGKAEQLIARFRAESTARVYQTYEEIMNDPAAQVVHLVVPNRYHFAMAKAALEAGKHVLCEKPLAMNPAESAALVELARKHPQQAAAVNYNIRFYPLCLEARERVRGGDIGDLFHISGSYVQDWLLWQTDYNWRVLAAEGGDLRAVADIGTHWLDLISSITGLDIESVCADLRTVHPQRQKPAGEIVTFAGKNAPVAAGKPVDITTDDYGGILLRLSGGVRANLTVSQVNAGRKNCLRFEMAGSKKALAWNSESPNEMWIGHRDEPNQLLLRDPALLGGAARAAADYPGGHNEGFDDSFKAAFRVLYDYIGAGDFTAPPPYPTFADGHKEIVVCEAILKSHRERRWVDIKEIA